MTNPLHQFLKRFFFEHRGKIIFALILNLTVGGAIAFQNVIPKFLIDDALLKEGIDMDERKQRLISLALLYVVVGVFARALLWNASLRIFGRVRETCVFELRSLFFRHVNHLCLSFHARRQSGELFSYLLGSPIQQIQQYYQQLAMMLPCHFVAIILTLGFLGSWDLYLSALTLVILLVFCYVLYCAQLRMREIQRDYQNAESKVSGKVADLLRGHRTVKVHAFEETALEDFQLGAGILRDKSYWRDVAHHMQNVKQEAILYIGYALLCVGAGWRFLSGDLTEGQLTAYLTSFIALQGPLGLFFQISILRGGSQASLERIGQVLGTDSTTPDPDKPEPVPTGASIAFRNVTFTYGNEPALRQVSLEIPYGQNVALVGASGAGKSTFVQLALRLYDPNEGTVELNGMDVRRIEAKALRRRFGVVPQDPFFFNASVADNLRVADPSATFERLTEVCRQANAWEFIEHLPGQLEGIIGEGGATLSGGQKQRLAIARALLADPEYFIFDEATSALDTVSEALIRDAISRITAHRTALFIAHRFASITHCDRIVVLDGGRIVQDGGFEELAARPGPFRDLVQTQNLAQHS
ncbi:MAG: ABC transporter ATP-binding protein [Candidatus Methylacidiphilales bacterium]